MTQPTIYAYVGTYTDSDSKGIYVYRMDATTGKFTLVGTMPGLPSPSFLAIHPSKRYLYSVNEVHDIGGREGGAVSAFAIDRGDGRLTALNQQSSIGKGPCHVVVDATGKFALVANYASGSVCVLPIAADGSLGEATDFVQHRGSSVSGERQAGPHAHSTTLDPNNRIAIVADLGLDKLMIYQLDLASGKLMPNDPPWAHVKAGAGPRHFAFHPSGKYAYVINELDNTVTAFAYDASRGALQELQALSTLPEGYSEVTYCSDLHVAPTGKFVYGSNRGLHSIAIFAIDEATGRLTFVDRPSTRGEWPRNFALDPTNRYLFVANQHSNNIVTFKMDAQTGGLTPAGQVIAVPKPACVKFVVV